ncbi:hypothetical protein BYT27DRAFT_7248916 [Phlegmacium glaucopus]|nr:hypothetical protein BYT27DRAFT_7248916 [Phlegmacium glaucopus]
MAGKKIEESKEARWRDRDSKASVPPASTSGPSSHIQVSVKGTDRHSYLMYTDTSSLTPITGTPPATRESARITSIEPEQLSEDDLEYHGFMAGIWGEHHKPKSNEEYKVNIDWNNYSLDHTDTTAASVFTHYAVSNPFLLDSGASSGISPVKSAPTFNFSSVK